MRGTLTINGLVFLECDHTFQRTTYFELFKIVETQMRYYRNILSNIEIW